MLEGYSPNCGIEETTDIQRLGRRIKIPSLFSTGSRSKPTLRENSFQINGPRLYNSFPRKTRQIKYNQDDFKKALDEFLITVYTYSLESNQHNPWQL